MVERELPREGPGDVARLLARDETAWRELHDREFTFLYRYARGMGADPDLAEDCASECFARLLHKLGGLQIRSYAALRAWLIVVCRNYLRDQLRRDRNSDRDLDGVDAAAPDRDPLTAIALARALAALPEAQREVLVMRFTLGMTTAQVATALGRGVKAVESLQHRALESLRRSPHLSREDA